MNRFFISTMVLLVFYILETIYTELAMAENNIAISVQQQAIKIVKEHSLQYKTEAIDLHSSLQEIVGKLDTYSTYLSVDEYEGFKISQKSTYAGVGMEIERNHTGDIVCFPYMGSPAARAGIKCGDILKSVNGVSIMGMPALKVVPMIRGKTGTSVNLGVQKESGVKAKIRIIRRKIKSDTIRWSRRLGVPIIKIQNFIPGTSRELKFVLSKFSNEPEIIIDLRGNGGGDFHAAMDTASLFLGNGEKIVEVQKNKINKIYFSTTPDQYSTKKIHLLQDKQTASAAEVFISALTDNGRADSIGEKTFGKGTLQEIFELIDGSSLFLTTGHLVTPSGLKFHEKGLSATQKFNLSESSLEKYIRKIRPNNIISKIKKKRLNKNDKVSELESNKKNIKLKDKKNEIKEYAEGKLKQNIDKKEYFVCLDKNFISIENAEAWYHSELQQRQPLPTRYILQRNTPEGVRHIICIYAFEDKRVVGERIKSIMNETGQQLLVMKVPSE